MRLPPTRLRTSEAGDVRQIASSLPRMVYERLDEAAEFVGAPQSVLIRRAVCRYLQDMEEKKVGA